MSAVVDPVCAMTIQASEAAAESSYDGRTFYFCSVACQREFDSKPARYADKAAKRFADREVPLESHEPNFTRKGFPAPKFGSAGSGGAEFEPGPERHADDR